MSVGRVEPSRVEPSRAARPQADREREEEEDEEGAAAAGWCDVPPLINHLTFIMSSDELVARNVHDSMCDGVLLRTSVVAVSH